MIGVAVQTVKPDTCPPVFWRNRNDQRQGSHSERFAEKLCQKAKESCVFRRCVFATIWYCFYFKFINFCL